MDTPRLHAPGGLHAHAAPYAAVGLLLVAGAALHAGSEASGDAAAFAATVGACAFVLAVLVGMKKGQRIACPRSRRRLRALLIGLAVWLGAVVASGVSWGAVEVLAILVTAMSLHWWRSRRIPDAPAVTEEAVASGYAELWRNLVGARDASLPGSRLEDERKIESGSRFTLRLMPGKQTQDSVESERGKIRGALGLMPLNDLVIEQHPTLPEPHLMLTVVTRQPPRGSVLWPGPSALGPDGYIALGPFADGVDTARWKAFTENRAWGGFLQGGTGSGKSRMIESIVMALAGSELLPSVVWWADGQGGASSKLLKRRCDRVALSVQDCRAMLEDVVATMEHRQDENCVEDLDGFTPTAARPALFVVLDECHVFFLADPEIQAMSARIAREGGKVGVALICATQQAQLAAAFGGGGEYADAIRSNVLAGNGVMLRGKSKSARQIFGVEVDPTQFPARPGYGFLVDPAEGARRAPFLGYFVSDDLQREWPDKITWRELDAGAANSCGPRYRDRVELAAAELAERRARVEARRAGRPVPGAASMRPAPLLAPAGLWPIAPLPVWINPTATPAPAAQVTGIHRRVVEAITSRQAMRSGYTMPHLMADHLGVSVKWAGIALRELVELGVLECPASAPQGQYHPTGKSLPTGKVA